MADVMIREFKHWSVEPFELDRAFQYPEPRSFKPSGLWVSDGDEWLEWCDENYHCGEHCYRVEIDMENVLLIDTVAKLEEFADEFAFVPEWMAKYSDYTVTDSGYVDWSAVQSRWSGVVISPYHWQRRLDLLFYYSWDVASGCVWDLDIIVNIEPSDNMKEIPHENYS